MKITVRAKTNSRKEQVTKLQDGSFLVRVNAPPIEGQANERICELIAEFFNVSKSQVRLVLGSKGKQKVFEIAL